MNLYLIGGGGHCNSCIDVIESEAKYKISGIFDNKLSLGTTIFDYKVIGTDAEITRYIDDNTYFLITIGQIKNNNSRVELCKFLKSHNANLATVISPRSHISKYAFVGEGSIVLHDVLVNSNSQIGVNCIINSKALIEHDVQVADHCHISTGSIVNGNVNIGDNCFIGSNSTIRQGLSIPNNTFVQAGSFYSGK